MEQDGLFDFLYKYVRADFLKNLLSSGHTLYRQSDKDLSIWKRLSDQMHIDYKCNSQRELMHFDDFFDFLELKEANSTK